MKAYKVYVINLDEWDPDDRIVSETYFFNEAEADKYIEEQIKIECEENEVSREELEDYYEYVKEEINIREEEEHRETFQKYILYIREGKKKIFYSTNKDFENYSHKMKFFNTKSDAKRARSYIYKYGIATKEENIQIEGVTVAVIFKEKI